MSKKIFVSLPVIDVKASMTFYESLGFKNNPKFTARQLRGWWGAMKSTSCCSAVKNGRL